ncbi:DUF134 domain-containing protein [Methanonatronarchaeum sp. AMET6-2]|uniref:DUF134 domain-containing protein n=1 Tax=Methanonatronarchaeum sp. AMET6-2 TaxID=2933293 RepID=UPI00120921F5|nr:DUF134 domain-containing protein [Methanonatronarchaeum sp. AMET6-2]RZN62908.1 MAG: DUF134 domain-containing protein [Methanonatronarchaeia archaeon]UOY09839.1 DUF134 domain-containing protein [Methanonatronarchaeum sp. AMET6-2]
MEKKPPGKGKGRPRRKRRVGWTPETDVFKPKGKPSRELEQVVITIEEMEAIRLVDLENYSQKEAAEKMGVSRRPFWNDLNSGRRKIAEALTQGKSLVIKGGTYSEEK